MTNNKPEFILEFVTIINQLGGRIMYPRKITQLGVKIIVRFNVGEYFDYINMIYLQVDEIDEETGVKVKSIITNRNFVSLSQYIFLLVSDLEQEHKREYLMKPKVAHYYFKGREELQQSLN
jgi:hypothetical protein